MGRRSINTTKSGKFMNPTDQARKEARKRELKKNKKQRLLVRAAVLKGKDPHQIIADLERLDQMEYNIHNPPPLNEKVLKDKRRKLKETWDRITRLYAKEDPEKHSELKRIESDYQAKQSQMIKLYEAVKSTHEVVLDEIPLPDLPADPSSMPSGGDLNIATPVEPHSILKKTSKVLNKEPPGVPPGPPPILSDIESDDDANEEKDEKVKKVRFGAESSSKQNEPDISEFLKEIEQVEKTATSNENNTPTFPPINQTILTPKVPNAGSLRAVPPPPMYMLRPPIPPNMPPGGPLRLGVPMRGIGNRPPMNLPQPPIPPLPIRNPNLQQQRIPAPPPPMQRLPGPSRQHNPNLNIQRKGDKKSLHIISDKATIEAKPQLRNLSADSTRFLPLSLKIKRNEKSTVKKPMPSKSSEAVNFYSGLQSSSSETSNRQTKDEAYEDFMKELQGLMSVKSNPV